MKCMGSISCGACSTTYEAVHTQHACCGGVRYSVRDREAQRLREGASYCIGAAAHHSRGRGLTRGVMTQDQLRTLRGDFDFVDNK
jgi:hypothetical protein